MGMSSPTAQRHQEVSLLIPTSARTVLVVGCGDGALGYALKRERAVEVSGIEMSPAATKAREVLDRVYSGNLENVADKIPAGYFDCILYTDVLERVTNPLRAITQLKRCLKPQGVVIVTARNARYWPVLKAMLEDNFREEDGGAQTETQTPSQAPAAAEQEKPRLLSKAALLGILKAAGFEVSIVRPVRESDQSGMPDAVRLAVESELNLTGPALAEETKDTAYMIVARPASAAPVRVLSGISDRATAGVPAGASSNVSAASTASTASTSSTAPTTSGAPAAGRPGGATGSVPALPPAKLAGSSAPAAAAAPKGQPPPPPKRKPIASIVVLTWNQKDLTEKLLCSLETTTKVPHEVIVVDNGSTDDTLGFLKTYAEECAAKSLDIRPIINSENAGISRGFNQGIKEAKGDYVVLLHNDIVLPANWLERMIRHFRADKKVGLVGPRSNSAKPHQSAPLGYRDLGEFPGFAETFYGRHQGNRTAVESLGGFCLAIRRDVLAKTGLFDESYEIARYEDDDLCMRARTSGFHLVVADDIYVHHAGAASFRKNEVDPLKLSEINRAKFIDRWGLKPSITYVMRWASQSAAAHAVFRQVNDLAGLGYNVRIISFEGKPEFSEVKAEFLRVGAFEMLPPLEDDVVIVCSALDLPVIAPKCRGKLAHLCIGYESYTYGSTAEDIAAVKPQIERYHSVPCARIVTSKHLQDLFASKFSQTTLLVPGWVDPVLGSPRQTVWPGIVENANILFVGRPVLPKGIADFTAAIRAVREKYPNAKMHLAVPPRTIGTQEKAEAMFEGPVELHAALSKTEMESLYRSVDIAVFPSWYEGSAINVMEAMACGAPVITADSLGIRDVCRDGENALVVPPAYPRKLAQAITRLMEDEGLRQRLATEGPVVAAKYTREESTKALQQAMNTIFRWEVVPAGFKPAPQEAGMSVTPGLTSIVVVTMNAFEFTQKCLESIFTCTDADPFELIVVDNGSTDGTWTFLESLARKHPNVRVLHNPHNTGFAHAADQTGEFVVTLHSDTLVTKGWLRRLKRIASSVPGAGLVGPVSNNVSGEQAVEATDLRTSDQIQGYAGAMAVRLAGQTMEVSRLSGFCLMAKREVLDRIGVMDSVFPMIGFEDDDFSVRARLAGFKCLIAQDVFVYHFRGRSFSDNVLDRTKIMEQNRRRFLRKWAALLKGSGGGVDLGDENDASATPLTGAERLARRIAERAGTGAVSDEFIEYLPPEEAGPVPSLAATTPATRATRRPEASMDTGASDKEDPEEAASSMDADVLHSKADAQLQAGRFIIALAMFERILKVHPLDVWARYNAAVCAIQTGDTRRARRYLNSILAEPEPVQTGTDLMAASSAAKPEPPPVPGIYNLFGISFLVEQDFNAATSCFEKALSIDPAFAEAMENLKVAQERAARD